MIVVDNLWKSYPAHGGKVDVLKGINFQIAKGEKLGIVGGNGAGKSTLFRLISGVERPTRGTVTRHMSVSWPLAFGGGFQGTLTGYDNARFICRVYGVRFEDVIGFIEDFTELGRYLREPIRVYSSGMRARLAFAISLMIEFDCYLIDEVVAVGDARFQMKCREELFEKRADRAFIIVSHDANYLKAYCEYGAVLQDGQLVQFGALNDAVGFHVEHMQA